MITFNFNVHRLLRKNREGLILKLIKDNIFKWSIDSFEYVFDISVKYKNYRVREFILTLNKSNQNRLLTKKYSSLLSYFSDQYKLDEIFNMESRNLNNTHLFKRFMDVFLRISYKKYDKNNNSKTYFDKFILKLTESEENRYPKYQKLIKILITQKYIHYTTFNFKEYYVNNKFNYFGGHLLILNDIVHILGVNLYDIVSISSYSFMDILCKNDYRKIKERLRYELNNGIYKIKYYNMIVKYIVDKKGLDGFKKLIEYIPHESDSLLNIFKENILDIINFFFKYGVHTNGYNPNHYATMIDIKLLKYNNSLKEIIKYLDINITQYDIDDIIRLERFLNYKLF